MLPFLQNFSWAFVRMDPVIVLAKIEVCSFIHPWDNSDWSFGWGANPNLGEGEAVGRRGWYRSKERWWVPIGSLWKMRSPYNGERWTYKACGGPSREMGETVKPTSHWEINSSWDKLVKITSAIAKQHICSSSLAMNQGRRLTFTVGYTEIKQRPGVQKYENLRYSPFVSP